MADATPGMIFTDILQNKRPRAVAWVGGNLWTAKSIGKGIIGLLCHAG